MNGGPTCSPVFESRRDAEVAQTGADRGVAQRRPTWSARSSSRVRSWTPPQNPLRPASGVRGQRASVRAVACPWSSDVSLVVVAARAAISSPQPIDARRDAREHRHVDADAPRRPRPSRPAPARRHRLRLRVARWPRRRAGRAVARSPADTAAKAPSITSSTMIGRRRRRGQPARAAARRSGCSVVGRVASTAIRAPVAIAAIRHRLVDAQHRDADVLGGRRGVAPRSTSR